MSNPADVPSQTVSDHHILTSKDREYLNDVISNICLPTPSIHANSDSSDSSYLFKLFVTPPDSENLNLLNIQGDNAALNEANVSSKPLTDQQKDNKNTKGRDKNDNMKGDNDINHSELTDNMKGDNTANPPMEMKT